jgi:hemoglobin/transferrin/lactoferrin receptor protein
VKKFKLTQNPFHLSSVSAALRRSLLGGMLCGAFGVVLAAEPVSIEIEAQPLRSALARFSEQSGVKAVYPDDLLRGKQAPTIRGKLTPAKALEQLLAGSGLRYQFVTADAVKIEANTRTGEHVHDHALAEVVVSATRTANLLDQVAASVSVVNREDFEEAQASSVSQVLKVLPNVEFGGGPRVNGEIPSIRGYTGKSITLLVDGARQNNATTSLRSPLFIDPYFIGKAEVLRGSASSLYGPGGAGGAMAFSTISARDFLAPDEQVGGGIKFGHATGDRSSRVNARAYAQNDVVDALVAVGYQDWNNIRQGGGSHLNPNDGDAASGLFKVGLKTSNFRYELSHLQYNSENLENNNPQADATLPGAPAIQNVKTSQQQSVLKVTTLETSDWPVISATLYNTDLKVTADQGVNASTAPYTQMRTETNGASLQASLGLGGSSAVRQRLTAGVDYFEDHQSAISGKAPNPVIPDGRQEVMGVFLQDEISLGSSVSLTPSLRADRFDSSASHLGLSSSASHVSPKMVLAWQAVEGLTVYGSYGEAFRAPTINELYSFISGRNYFNNFRSNPDLKPEVDETLEIGGNLALRGLLSDRDRFKLRLSIFDARATDLISQTVVGTYSRSAPFAGTGTIFQSQNVAKAKRTGGELEASYGIGQWQYKLNYSRVRVTDSSNGSGLFSPPDKLSLQVRHQLPRQGITLSWTTTGVAAQDYDATVLRRRPGYATSDLFVSWTPSGQKFRFDVGVGNIFDHRYAAYMSSAAYAYTYLEGRSLRTSFSMDF